MDYIDTVAQLVDGDLAAAQRAKYEFQNNNFPNAGNPEQPMRSSYYIINFGRLQGITKVPTGEECKRCIEESACTPTEEECKACSGFPICEQFGPSAECQ